MATHGEEVKAAVEKATAVLATATGTAVSTSAWVVQDALGEGGKEAFKKPYWPSLYYKNSDPQGLVSQVALFKSTAVQSITLTFNCTLPRLKEERKKMFSILSGTCGRPLGKEADFVNSTSPDVEISLNLLRLEQIKEYLLGVGVSEGILNDCVGYKFFRQTSKQEDEFYAKVANITKELTDAEFDELFKIAKILESQQKNPEINDYLFVLGMQCHGNALHQFSYKALELVKNKALIPTAAFTMANINVSGSRNNDPLDNRLATAFLQYCSSGSTNDAMKIMNILAGGQQVQLLSVDETESFTVNLANNALYLAKHCFNQQERIKQLELALAQAAGASVGAPAASANAAGQAAALVFSGASTQAGVNIPVNLSAVDPQSTLKGSSLK